MTAPPPPPPLPPAGWYPDPTGKPGQAYWDGRAWHNAAPATTSPAYAPTPWDKVQPHFDRARPQVDKARRFWSGLPRQRQFIVAIGAIAGLFIAVAFVASFLGSDQSDAPGQPAPHSSSRPPWDHTTTSPEEPTSSPGAPTSSGNADDAYIEKLAENDITGERAARIKEGHGVCAKLRGGTSVQETLTWLMGQTGFRRVWCSVEANIAALVYCPDQVTPELQLAG